MSRRTPTQRRRSPGQPASQLFREAREARGLSISETALLAELTPRALAYIESGAVKRPHMRTVRAVARALGIQPNDLLPEDRAKEVAA